MPDILTREEIDTVADVWSKVAPETEDQAEDKKHILQLCDTARHYWCEMVDAEDRAEYWWHQYTDSQEKTENYHKGMNELALICVTLGILLAVVAWVAL